MTGYRQRSCFSDDGRRLLAHQQRRGRVYSTFPPPSSTALAHSRPLTLPSSRRWPTQISLSRYTREPSLAFPNRHPARNDGRIADATEWTLAVLADQDTDSSLAHARARSRHSRIRYSDFPSSALPSALQPRNLHSDPFRSPASQSATAIRLAFRRLRLGHFGSRASIARLWSARWIVRFADSSVGSID